MSFGRDRSQKSVLLPKNQVVGVKIRSFRPKVGVVAEKTTLLPNKTKSLGSELGIPGLISLTFFWLGVRLSSSRIKAVKFCPKRWRGSRKTKDIVDVGETGGIE
ncbi:MAG: hypothetical protein HC895_02720 [Leptolyngbyaceae cyanobacterium SM1_3_5]|nr:hypothetical protein [Leptolyngbyaceae cyanobacterium SM1_3_5]